MKSRTLIVLAMFAVFAGCGKSDLIRVARPAHPRYVCWLFPPVKFGPDHRSIPQKPGCMHRFDANRLLGLSVTDAERLARAHGYMVRVLEELNPANLVSNRLDVEATSPTGSGVITKIAGEG